MTRLLALLLLAAQLRIGALHRRLRTHGERGDVPGWVLVTLMSALIVAALWTIARDQLINLFQDAMTRVG